MSETAATVLVVDDDEFTAELTGMILESAGYDVVIAIGGMEALEKIAENASIGLILSDMNMPFMDGIQLFAELREQGYSHPFVLLTGEDSTPLKLAHPNMDAIITKDENLQDILPAIVSELLA
ncbi:MAG TPA: response regulator [Desulfuromonadales bacterium]|nr:response regulator [Desulfuromonadales bacterium]